MSEAQHQGPAQPRIRDPHAPINLVGNTAAASSGDTASSDDTVSFEELHIASAADAPAARSGMAGGSHLDNAGDIDGTADGETDGDDHALAVMDPLTRRPRISSSVLCVVFALVLFASAAGIWWLGVRTENGQSFDDLAVANFNRYLPGWLTAVLHPFTLNTGFGSTTISSLIIIAVSALLAIAAGVVTLIRRRWWLAGQLVVFGAVCYVLTWLKELLPRPFIIHTQVGTTSNSAPSGHVILAAACALALVMAVPRVLRALAAVIAAVWSTVVGLSVIAGAWHRPTDVVMALLLVGGAALLMLACTRTSGMDATGKRASSASVQILGSVMITGGCLALLYGAYVVWQVVPGLSMSAQWAQSGAVGGSCVLIAGLTVLLAGLVLALRQLTAAPLSRLGLVGAPPAPPTRLR